MIIIVIIYNVVKINHFLYCIKRTILSNVDYFTELPFYNEFIEKPNIKHLKNVDLLAEQPFYEQLDVVLLKKNTNLIKKLSLLQFILIHR